MPRPSTDPLIRCRLLARDDPGRDHLERHIAACFLATYGARLQQFMPRIAALEDPHGRLLAAFGLRAADEDRLFVERYLDAPIEAVLAAQSGRALSRARILEIGNLAASEPGVQRLLAPVVGEIARSLGHEVVVFAATATLRNALARCGLAPRVLAPARAERLGADAEAWGRYYAARPQVIAAEVAPGLAQLRTFPRAPASCKPGRAAREVAA